MKHCLFSLGCLLTALTCLAQPQTAWIARYNGGFTNKTHTPLAMKLDGAGNIYVAGSSQNASNYSEYVVLKYAPNGTQIFAARYSPTNGTTYPANGFTLDQNGNTYVTGGILRGPYGVSYLIGNGATVKFNTNGQIAWTAPYPGNDVAVDTNGNVYVTGFSLTQYATIKLNSRGSNLWMQTYVGVSGPNNPKSISQKVAVDNAGNVYVAGWTDHPPGWTYPGQTNINYYSHPAMLMYNAAGNCVWTNTYAGDGGIYWGNTVGLIADNQGNAYVTGNDDSVTCYQTVKIKTGGQNAWHFQYGPPGVSGMALDAVGCIFLAGGVITGINDSTYTDIIGYGSFKLDSSGNKMWQTNYPGVSPTSSPNQASGIALDNIGNVYVTGVSTNNGTGNDFATIKYDANGNQQWVIRYNGPANGNDGATAIAVAPDGSIYVTGYSANASGGSDITTLKYAYPPVVQRNSDGSIQIQSSGVPGQTYDCQATTNFLNWIHLGSSLADTNGQLQFLDTNAPLFQRRFYRWSDPSP